MVRRSLVLVSSVLFIAAGLLSAPPAQATFPGNNGRIVAPSANGFRIVSMNSDGSGVKNLTKAFSGYAEAPRVSADGKWVVFDAAGLGTADLYKVQMNGTGLKRLTKGPNYEWGPSWSPDGKHIVYAKDAGYSTLMVMNADGSHRHPISGVSGDFPRYSPNGKFIAYGSAADGEIHVMHADGTQDAPITSTAGSDKSDFPDWSPDGTSILYWSNIGTTDQLHVVARTGGASGLVTNEPGGVDIGGSFSPKGTKVVFIAGTDIMVTPGGGTLGTDIGDSVNCCPGWQPT